MWPFTTKLQGKVNTQEAYTLWDMLSTRYTAVEQIQIFTNVIHDKDFKVLATFELNTTLKNKSTNWKIYRTFITWCEPY